MRGKSGQVSMPGQNDGHGDGGTSDNFGMRDLAARDVCGGKVTKCSCLGRMTDTQKWAQETRL